MRNVGERNPMFGKHHSEETREKMRKANIGKPKSAITLEKLRLANIGKQSKEKNPMFGKHHSEEAREKMRKAKLGKYNGKNNPNFGKRHSKETCEKIRLTNSGKTGERNGNWKGGVSFSPYCEKFDKKRRKAVREFFNNLCICTGEPQYTRALSVHHIDHDKEQGCNGKPFNLVPMSSEHHSKEIYNEEEYKQYINKTLREGFKWGIWNEQEYIEKVMY
jgi:hypothetical protein